MVDDFLENFGRQKNEAALGIIELRSTKADRHTVSDLKTYISEQLEGFDVKLDKQRDDQLTLEHYAERYIPIQIQQMIMDNMKKVHDETAMKLL